MHKTELFCPEHNTLISLLKTNNSSLCLNHDDLKYIILKII